MPNQGRLAAVADDAVPDTQVDPAATLPRFSVKLTLPLLPAPGLSSLSGSLPFTSGCAPVGENCVSHAARFCVKPESIILAGLMLVQDKESSRLVV